MSDAYLLLTPLLMLAVVALVGFVGCDALFGLDPVKPPLPGPTNLQAIAGDNRVDLSWDPYTGASDFFVYRSAMNEPRARLQPAVAGTITAFTDMTAANGTPYVYDVTARVSGSESSSSNTVTVTPGVDALIKFITITTHVTLQRFGGWVGMGIHVATRDLMIQKLGRFFAPGNGGTHRVKIVNGVAPFADVAGAFVMVAFDGTGVDMDGFKYEQLGTLIRLNANTDYYIISEETATGDQFYDSIDTRVTERTDVASRVYAVNGDGVGNYNTSPLDDFVYGPLNFQYSFPPL